MNGSELKKTEEEESRLASDAALTRVGAALPAIPCAFFERTSLEPRSRVINNEDSITEN